VTDANFYLGQGIGVWPETLEKEFRAAGGRVLLERSPQRLVLDEGRVAGIALNGDPAGILPCDFLLSTIPINELLPLLPDPGATASASAAALDYCAAALIFLKVKRPRVLPSSLLYFTAPTVAFSRASDYAFFSDRLAPEGETILCLELPCSANDAEWSRRDDELAEEGITLLESEGLLNRQEILGHAVERVTHAYPRFRRGYRDRVAACRQSLAQCGNLISYGRQGGFSYANLDGVSMMGMHAAAAALIAPNLGVPAQTWYDAQASAL
jgi:protoporphyrinogen oxidase